MHNNIENLLQTIYDKYGYDFSNYKRESIDNRVASFMKQEEITDVDDLLQRILDDSELFSRLVGRFTTSVTSMFRDPEVFLLLRQKVLPILATYPHVRIGQQVQVQGRRLTHLR